MFGVIAGMFHLFTHAFFKAVLFLGAGSVMHAMGNVIDMQRFGGLYGGNCRTRSSPFHVRRPGAGGMSFSTVRLLQQGCHPGRRASIGIMTLGSSSPWLLDTVADRFLDGRVYHPRRVQDVFRPGEKFPPKPVTMHTSRRRR